MENLSDFAPLFHAVIAFVAVLTGLGFVFNILLGPVKKDIKDLKVSHKELAGEMKAVQGEMKAVQGEMKAVQGEISGLKASHQSLNEKLDMLLSRS